MRRLLGLGAISGLVIWGPDVCFSTQAASVAPEPGLVSTAAEHAVLLARAQAAAADAAHEPPPEVVPWTAPEEAQLEGLAAAGQHLWSGRPELALENLERASSAAEGTRAWFVAAAIRGRASRAAGRPCDAVPALEPALAHGDVGTGHVEQLLALELARAHVECAQGLPVAEADAHLRAAMTALGPALRTKPTRYQAPMRVLYATTAAQVKGTDRKSTYWAAQKAIQALDRTIRDFPNHPALAQLRLERARARVRTGKPIEAAVELRGLALTHAGAPAAEQALRDLEALAAEHPRVDAEPFTRAEQLERAAAARQLRFVDESRAILDAIIADPEASERARSAARRSRAFTAYKQRDYDTCIADLAPAWEATHSLAVRDDLARCLDRGARFDEAIALWTDIAARKGATTGARAQALWEGLEVAVRGGRYQTAADLLAQYEVKFRAHVDTRRFLHAWLPYRLGDDEAALAGFAELERKSAPDATRARYFQGKIQLRSEDAERRTDGARLLRTLTEEQPLSYYGLMARARLLDAQADPGPVDPVLTAIPEEDRWLSWSDARREFESLRDAFPGVSSALARADVLHESGWVEEARRELRVAADEVIHGSARLAGRDGGKGPRSEEIVIGLGWRAEWTHPKPVPGKELRAVLRDPARADRMRAGLWRLSHALQEPHRFARLAPAGAEHKARWHPRAYRAAVEREAAQRRIDPTHLWALMYTESRFRRFVVSPVGARGALQIMPWTARQLEARLGGDGDDFDPDQLFELDTNVRLATYYVAELMHKFHGQAPMAYASYNGGPSNVARWLEAKAGGPVPLGLDDFVEEIPFDETQRYVRRVMEVQAAYELLYRGRLPRWTNDVDPVVEGNIDF
jgi:soluble lytic murein transglycosylase-like protein